MADKLYIYDIKIEVLDEGVFKPVKKIEVVAPSYSAATTKAGHLGDTVRVADVTRRGLYRGDPHRVSGVS